LFGPISEWGIYGPKEIPKAPGGEEKKNPKCLQFAFFSTQRGEGSTFALLGVNVHADYIHPGARG
jgi:hypothetical protein